MLTLHGPITIATHVSAGTATVYSGEINGRIIALLYQPGTIATGADMTFTGETTGQAILTVTNAGTSNLFLYPRTPVVGATNSAITDSWSCFCLPSERLKLAVAEGGNSKTGYLYVLAEEFGGSGKMIVKHTAQAIVQDAAGDCTIYAGLVNGKIIGIIYTQGTLEDAGTVTLTGETTGTPIVAFAGNASSPIYPRCGVVNASNAAITDSHDYVRLKDERVKVVFNGSAPGAAGAGSIQILTEE